MEIVDIHCHILPGIDDGAKNLEMAIQMAKIARDSGTTDIVVTPHHNNGVFRNERDDVFHHMHALQQALNEQKIDIKLHPGSELHLMPEIVQELAYESALTYADKGRAVLVELPKQYIPIGAQEILTDLLAQGLTPIIAHPERNGDILRDPKIYEKWVELGCCGQITAMSINGDFGSSIESVCDRWFKKGYIHFLASDAHRPQGRSPDLSVYFDYVEEEYGADLANLLFVENPRRLLDGMPIERQHAIKKRFSLSRMRKLFL